MLAHIPCNGIVEVNGSTPLCSTNNFNNLYHIAQDRKMVCGALLAYSIGQSLLQMRFVLINMGVNFRQHGAVTVPHDGRYGQMVVPLNQLSCGESVTSVIHRHALAGDFGEPVHSVADSIFGPRIAPIISEQLPLGISHHTPSDNFQSLPMQVDGSGVTLALGFNGRESDAFAAKEHMAPLYVTNLLRAATSIPNEQKQVAERVGRGKFGKDVLEVFRLHVIVPTLRLRLFELLNRVYVDIAQLVGPVVNTLYGDDSSTPVGVAPLRMGINPFHDMVGFEGETWHSGVVAKETAEAFDVSGVPLKAAGRSMQAAPCEVFVKKTGYCNAVFHALNIANRYSLLKGNILLFQRERMSLNAIKWGRIGKKAA